MHRMRPIALSPNRSKRLGLLGMALYPFCYLYSRRLSISVVLTLSDEVADEVKTQITHLIKTMGLDPHETADNPIMIQLFLADLEKAMAQANGNVQAFFDGNKPSERWTGTFKIRPFMDVSEHEVFPEEYAATCNQTEYGVLCCHPQ